MKGGGVRKTLEQYEQEAIRIGECLIHPSTGHVARKVYQMRHGPVLNKKLVCHTCDNSQCIEDKHHWIGSQKDNMQDAVRKGRAFTVWNKSDREKHSAIMKQLCNKPGQRKKQSTIQREIWKNPKLRAKQVNIQREIWKNPKLRAKHSAALQQMWNRPGYRAKMSDILSKAYKKELHLRNKNNGQYTKGNI